MSAALEFGVDLFAESQFHGMKRVIDISGDGPNNQGPPVDLVRDELVKQGITINGLPLMTNGGLSSAYDVTDLDQYYTDCVIGGPGRLHDPRQRLVAVSRGYPAQARAGTGRAVFAGNGLPRNSASELPVVLAQSERSL